MTHTAISSVVERLTATTETVPVDDTAINALSVHFGERLREKGYIVDERNERAVRAVCAYVGRKAWAIVQDIPSAEPKKGLFLHGGTGAGKTMLMRLYCRWFPYTEFVRMDELAGMFSSGGMTRLDAWLDSHDTDDIMVDDFGAEVSTSFYGGQFPTLHVLEKRLASLERWGRVTHYTSNITDSTMLRKMYNPQIASRIMGNCVFVGFGGCDRRLAR